MRRSRRPEIMADAAHAILTRPSREFSGRFMIDDDMLALEGVTDFSNYAYDPAVELMPDIFIDPGAPLPPGSVWGPQA